MELVLSTPLDQAPALVLGIWRWDVLFKSQPMSSMRSVVRML